MKSWKQIIQYAIHTTHAKLIPLFLKNILINVEFKMSLTIYMILQYWNQMVHVDLFILWLISKTITINKSTKKISTQCESNTVLQIDCTRIYYHWIYCTQFTISHILYNLHFHWFYTVHMSRFKFVLNFCWQFNFNFCLILNFCWQLISGYPVLLLI